MATESFNMDIAVFDPFNVTVEDKIAVYSVSIAFSVLGMGGAIAIIAHAIAKKIVKNIAVLPLFHLSLANVGFCLFFLVISAFDLAIQIRSLNIDSGISDAGIVIVTAEEAFYLMSFLLTANYSLIVYVRLKDRLNVLEQLKPLRAQAGFRFMFKLLYALSWSLPWLILVPVVAAAFGKHIEVKLCFTCPSITFYPCPGETIDGAFGNWILKNYGLFVLLMTFTISTTAILILYILSRRVCCKLNSRSDVQESQMNSIRRLLARLSCYMVCYFISWTPTFILAVVIVSLDLKGTKECKTCTFLLYIWAITAPCQGFLNAIVYFYWAYRPTRTVVTEQSSKMPIASRAYRFYGSGDQRSKWPKARTPSPSMSESSDSTVPTATTPTPRKVRSPSFLTLLDNERYEPTD